MHLTVTAAQCMAHLESIQPTHVEAKAFQGFGVGLLEETTLWHPSILNYVHRWMHRNNLYITGPSKFAAFSELTTALIRLAKLPDTDDVRKSVDKICKALIKEATAAWKEEGLLIQRGYSVTKQKEFRQAWIACADSFERAEMGIYATETDCHSVPESEDNEKKKREGSAQLFNGVDKRARTDQPIAYPGNERGQLTKDGQTSSGSLGAVTGGETLEEAQARSSTPGFAPAVGSASHTQQSSRCSSGPESKEDVYPEMKALTPVLQAQTFAEHECERAGHVAPSSSAAPPGLVPLRTLLASSSVQDEACELRSAFSSPLRSEFSPKSRYMIESTHTLNRQALESAAPAAAGRPNSAAISITAPTKPRAMERSAQRSQHVHNPRLLYPRKPLQPTGPLQNSHPQRGDSAASHVDVHAYRPAVVNAPDLSTTVSRPASVVQCLPQPTRRSIDRYAHPMPDPPRLQAVAKLLVQDYQRPRTWLSLDIHLLVSQSITGFYSWFTEALRSPRAFRVLRFELWDIVLRGPAPSFWSTNITCDDHQNFDALKKLIMNSFTDAMAEKPGLESFRIAVTPLDVVASPTPTSMETLLPDLNQAISPSQYHSPYIAVRIQLNAHGGMSKPYPAAAVLGPQVQISGFFAWFAKETGHGGSNWPAELRFSFKDVLPTPKNNFITRGNEEHFDYMKKDIKPLCGRTAACMPDLSEFTVLVTVPGWAALMQHEAW